MNRILLIEDDNDVANSIKGFLSLEGYTVDLSPSLQFLQNLALKNFDLILLDWNLPDGQGVEWLKTQRMNGLNSPVILLTARNELIDKVLGLELGANDYITKPFEPRELLARIGVQLRSKYERTKNILKSHEITLCSESRQVMSHGQEISLKKMEFNLLRFFLENKDKAFSRDELLNQVWGFENYPDSRTVDTHILNLRTKLKTKSIETLRGFGYRFKGDEN